MKFKATLSDRGLRVLEKGFLPTLEKLGKRCQLLLGPEDVHLIQSPADTDGLQVTARLANVRFSSCFCSNCLLQDDFITALQLCISMRMGVLKLILLPLSAETAERPCAAPMLQVVLFEEEGFKCQSRYENQIAFSVDIALLLKVL